MTNAERKTHVIRILGRNKAGDIVPDIWADVERIDTMEFMTQVINEPGGAVEQYQKVTIKLRWLDDPDGNDYDPEGDRNREHKVVKVCDPSLSQDELDDPEEWIPIRSILQMEVKHAGGNILKLFKDSGPNSDIDSRVIANRRITHWDSSIDEAATAAFEGDPARKVYVVAGRDYDRIEDTEDEDQYVEHQIVKKLNRQDSQQLLSTGNDQRRVLHLKNQYQIDESHPAKLQELGKNDINPPYRLDPFQNIINVQMLALKQVVIGMPDPGFSDPAVTMSTKNGEDFNTEQFGPGTFSAASGLGKTVVGTGTNLVAFGKPKEGPACFIVVSGDFTDGSNNTIRRGVLNPESGALDWTEVASFPSADGCDAFSCCFAGGAFFIQYLAIDGNNVGIATSFDGTTFSLGNPFPGVDLSGICNPNGLGENAPNPVGGSVAYDKKTKRYVTTGSYFRRYSFHFTIHGDLGDVVLTSNTADGNFMSAVSTDGLTWTPKFDVSQGFGTENFPTNPEEDIGNNSGGASTVCFSDKLKLFVASSTYKNNDQNNDNSASNTAEFPVFVPASAVATSEDGVEWTNRLVGSPSSREFGEGDQYSFSYCVSFIRTATVDPVTQSNGFFLVGINGGADGDADPERDANEIWRSENGIDWVSVRLSDVGMPLAMTQINKNFNPDNLVTI